MGRCANRRGRVSPGRNRAQAPSRHPSVYSDPNKGKVKWKAAGVCVCGVPIHFISEIHRTMIDYVT